MQPFSESISIPPIVIGGDASDTNKEAIETPAEWARDLFVRALPLIDSQPGEALRLLDQASVLAPDVAAVQSAMHSALCRLGRDREALLRIDAAIRLDPTNGEHHYNRAVLVSGMGNDAEAEKSYRDALHRDPQNLDAFINLGNILTNARRFTEALACLDHVIARRPDDIDANNNRLNVLVAAGHKDEACEGFSRMVSKYPGRPTLMLNFANALRAAGRSEESEQWVSLARSIDPAGRGTRLHTAKLLLAQGYAEDAVDALRKLVREAPGDDEAVSSLALALRTSDPHGHETRKIFDRLESLPSAQIRWRTAIGQWKLLHGDFASGLIDYEGRWTAPDGPRLRRNYCGERWTGSQPINDKTVLVHFEQGAGDTLQFVRYLKLLKDQGARVILEVPSSVERLLRDSDLADEVITSGGQDHSAYDFHCPMMSLPLAFGTTLQTVPNCTPYVKADVSLCDAWRERLGERRAPRIGIVWSGRRENSRDETRSISFMQFMRALPLGPEYVCLQPEIRREDAFLMQARPDILHFADYLGDYADTAALIEQLDWVISVDTSVAHLAGALNKPVWILLPLDPDFRWLLGRDDSPWYPSAHLYRQPEYQNWNTVLTRVRNDILTVLDRS